MILKDFIRWFFGYIKVRISGNNPERFLSLLTGLGIYYWNLKNEDGQYTLNMVARNFFKLKNPANKTATRVKILEKKGAPFHTMKYKKRHGIIFGLATFVVIILVLSGFVWTIDVTGNKTVQSELIYNTLSELGVKRGTYIRKINFIAIEERLILKVPELSWAGISLNGSKLSVEVRERVKKPDILPEGIPCNIVARKDGFILSMNVYSGQKMLKKGDSVVKGDLIISGILTDKNGNTALTHSKGSVIAQTEETREYIIPLKETIKDYTGVNKKYYNLHFFSSKLPLHFKIKNQQKLDIVTTRKNLSLLSINSFIDIEKLECKEYNNKDIILKPEQAKSRALNLLKEYKIKELSNAKIISINTTDKLTENSFILTANIICEENIAKEEEIYIGG